VKVTLSGASGFVGRHVRAELMRRGVDTTLLLHQPSGGCGLDEVVFDHRQDPDGLYQRCGRPDVLLHLAWGGLPNYDSLHHFEQERPAHYRLIQALVRAGLPHVVVTGTCAEYGLQSGPLREDMDCRPVNAYGHAKHTLRQDLALFARVQPFRLSWARLFFLHGEGQSPTSLLPLLRSAVARGDAVFPMSGGEQLRDYMPVETAARHLVTLALQPRGEGIVNVCSGQPVSVRSLVEGWIRDHGWAITPQFGHHPYPGHEPMAFWGDDTRLRQLMQLS